MIYLINRDVYIAYNLNSQWNRADMNKSITTCAPTSIHWYGIFARAMDIIQWSFFSLSIFIDMISRTSIVMCSINYSFVASDVWVYYVIGKATSSSWLSILIAVISHFKFLFHFKFLCAGCEYSFRYPLTNDAVHANFSSE